MQRKWTVCCGYMYYPNVISWYNSYPFISIELSVYIPVYKYKCTFYENVIFFIYKDIHVQYQSTCTVYSCILVNTEICVRPAIKEFIVRLLSINV